MLSMERIETPKRCAASAFVNSSGSICAAKPGAGLSISGIFPTQCCKCGALDACKSLNQFQLVVQHASRGCIAALVQLSKDEGPDSETLFKIASRTGNGRSRRRCAGLAGEDCLDETRAGERGVHHAVGILPIRAGLRPSLFLIGHRLAFMPVVRFQTEFFKAFLQCFVEWRSRANEVLNGQ